MELISPFFEKNEKKTEDSLYGNRKVENDGEWIKIASDTTVALIPGGRIRHTCQRSAKPFGESGMTLLVVYRTFRHDIVSGISGIQALKRLVAFRRIRL